MKWLRIILQVVAGLALVALIALVIWSVRLPASMDQPSSSQDDRPRPRRMDRPFR